MTTADAAGGSHGDPRPPVALYVHFPFCLSICPYCDFVVYAGRSVRGPTSKVDAFVRALTSELALRGSAMREVFGSPAPLASVYFGGGTPSLLSPDQLAGLLSTVEREFGLAADAELTLEVNPGPADRADLAGFRAAGISRLSVGAQSLESTELRRLGRRHEPGDVQQTVVLARAAGFSNVSLDLLYDVPGQTLGSWRRSLETAIALEPEHISAYALSLDDPDGEGLTGPAGDHLPLRAGARRWRDRARGEQDGDRAADCYVLADELLEQAGLRWYELSNWSRRGMESRHNLAYWQGLAYEAVGPGAHAFDGALTRRWNAARLEPYLAALLPAAPALPPGGSERLEPEVALAERAMLALRTHAGLPAPLTALAVFAGALSWAHSAGLLEAAADPARLRLTRRGRLLASELFWRLLREGQDPRRAA